jgi:hypothetical protein
LFRHLGDAFPDGQRRGGGRRRGIADVDEFLVLNNEKIIDKPALCVTRLRADAGFSFHQILAANFGD